uniref:SMC5-SMC6 complex localization factor 2 n=1 Tax=Molossus molossus TaxID=27622 RepID=A0A7J8DRV6_MOLMO|nr:SMC5-SMC6 complex localization factor 2 [Molossus molossus]
MWPINVSLSSIYLYLSFSFLSLLKLIKTFKKTKLSCWGWACHSYQVFWIKPYINFRCGCFDLILFPPSDIFKVKDLVARIHGKWQEIIQNCRPTQGQLHDFWVPDS